MAAATVSELPNGLPLHRIELVGTRAVTLLVAFDAGSRTERPDENGIAHFLEHLVFKGGEKFRTARDVNWGAERIGGRLNAYTSPALVAFHITARAERAPEAADLLTDFTARPLFDSEELDRERGVVIQEIARAYDQPAALADIVIDRAAFGDHPLGRSVLGPEEHLRRFTRDDVVAFRDRRWSPVRGAAFAAGNLSALPNGALDELFSRFPALPEPDPAEAAPAPLSDVVVEHRDSKQSHLRLIYRPEIDPHDPAARAALAVYTTLLGGSMGSRLADEIRERRGLAYSVRADDYLVHDAATLQLSAGLDSSHCIEAYGEMRRIVDELRSDGPTEEEVERARTLAAARAVLSFESTMAVAAHAAEMHVVFGEDVDPDRWIERLDAVELDAVREVGASVPEAPAVACVGPHEESDFDL